MKSLCSAKLLLNLSIGLWVIVGVSLVTQSFLTSEHHSVLYIYRGAVQDFWSRAPMYTDGPAGFNYLPQFAIIYSPFAALNVPIQSVTWRVFSLSLFLLSVILLGRFAVAGHMRRDYLAILLLAALPAAVSSLQSGQANMLLSAVMALAAVAIGNRRWNLAAILLVTAVMIKPLAIVLALLAVVVYRALAPRLAVGMAAAILLPFLLAPPAYVLSIYFDCIQNLRIAMPASGRIFADLFGIFRVLEIYPSIQTMTVTRIVASCLTLALWLVAAKRLPEPRRVEMLHCLATMYLMLFNPMNEMNSYVIFAPAVALLAARGLILAEARVTVGLLLATAISFGSDNYGLTIYYSTRNWLPPVMTLLVLAIAVLPMIAKRTKPSFTVVPVVRRAAA